MERYQDIVADFFKIFFLLTSLKGHDQFVNCVRYAPDGKFFVSASADGKVGHAGWSGRSRVCAKTYNKSNFLLVTVKSPKMLLIIYCWPQVEY